MEIETLKRSHLKRNILIAVVVVLVISAVILNFTRARYRVTQSIPLVNGVINYTPYDLKLVAMYQQNDDGEYVSIDEVPDSGYSLSTINSYCEVNDTKDESIQIEYQDGIINVLGMNQKGTKCYLYFDIKLTPATEVIEGLYEDNQDILVYDETDDGNLRYMGANPDNYVYFNCSDYSNPNSNTCELWRIIGVFDENTHGISGQKLVKLIRNDSLGNMAWLTSNNNWSTASLQQTLNDDYYNRTGSYSSTGITSSTRRLIETVIWKLGTKPKGENIMSPKSWYEYERGSETYGSNPTTWEGKIALMYPSDFGLATSGGTSTNRSSCVVRYMDVNGWGNTNGRYDDCKNNDWLYDNSNAQWTLTHSINYSNYVYAVLNDTFGGAVSNHAGSSDYAVYPTIYLTSNTAITGGTGTQSDPFTLQG